MADEHIKIRIGAVKDASTAKVLRDIRGDWARVGGQMKQISQQSFSEAARAAKRAQQQLEATGRTRITGAMRDAQTLMNLERKVERARVSSTQRAQRAEEARSKGQHAIAAKEHQRSQRNANVAMRLEERVAAHQVRTQRRQSEEGRRSEEANLRRSEALHQREARRRMQRRARRASVASYEISGALGRFMPQVPSIGQLGFYLGELARGVGVDLSPSSHLARAQSMESESIRLSNAGIIPGEERNIRRVGPGTFTSESLRIGNKYGVLGNDVQSGITQFQKVTGDTALAMRLLDPLTKINVSAGVKQSEGFAAAANISAQLGDMPQEEKVARIMKSIRAFIGQGKVGAVEFSDLARYAPTLVGSSRFFEGDITDTMKTMGVLAQASRTFGGSNNPAMAARSVSRLATTLKKPARVKAFQDMGIEPFNELGQIRNPIGLIRQAMVASQDDPTKWHSMFAELIGERAASGMSDSFRSARISALKGGASKEEAEQAGLKSFDNFLAYMNSQMSTPEMEDDNVQTWLAGSEAAANRMNNEFTSVADEVLPEFSRALSEATPALKELARTLGEWTVAMIENPWKTLGGGALAALIAGGIATAFRAGIERLILGGAGKEIAKQGAKEVVKQGARTGAGVLAGAAGGAAGGAALAGLITTGPAALAGQALNEYLTTTDPEAKQRANARFSGLITPSAGVGAPLALPGEEGIPFSSDRAKRRAENGQTMVNGNELTVANEGLMAAMNKLASVMDKGISVKIDSSAIPGGTMPGQESSMHGAR